MIFLSITLLFVFFFNLSAVLIGSLKKSVCERRLVDEGEATV